jgi:hypothetical protein
MRNIKTFEKFTNSAKPVLDKLIRKNTIEGLVNKESDIATGVLLEDSKLIRTKYNGWFKELVMLSLTDPIIEKILSKIKSNIIEFYSKDFEDSYQVVLKQECDGCKTKYNGWYEDLTNYLA